MRIEWAKKNNPDTSLSAEELHEKEAMDGLRFAAEWQVWRLRALLSEEECLAWIDEVLPHVPHHIRAQLAEPDSRLFRKVFSAVLHKEIQPDLTILEQILLGFWRIGSVASIRQLALALGEMFPWYLKMVRQRLRERSFKSPEGAHIPGRTALRADKLSGHMEMVLMRNSACRERLIEYVSDVPVRRPTRRTSPPWWQHIMYRLRPGHETEVFRDFSLNGDGFSTYTSLSPTTVQQATWAAPSTMTFPSIDGHPFPTSAEDKVQPILSKMPPEIMSKILAQCCDVLQFKDYTFSIGPDRDQHDNTHKFLGELRLCYLTDRTPRGLVEIHLPPLEILFAMDEIPHRMSGQLAIHFFTQNTFNVSPSMKSDGVAWLRNLRPEYLALIRKVELSIGLRFDPGYYGEDEVRLIGWVASMSNLQELILHSWSRYPGRGEKPIVGLRRRLRDVPEIKHLSKFRGVKLTCEDNRNSQSLLEERTWLKECMAQPKEAEGMTAYEGMATVEEVQMYIEQELEDDDDDAIDGLVPSVRL